MIRDLEQTVDGIDGIRTGAVAEFHSFVADIEDLVKATTSMTGEDLAQARAKLNARVSAARESVADLGGAAAAQARDAARVTNGFVHDNPWQAIGIGAALGVLVGFALASRK